MSDANSSAASSSDPTRPPTPDPARRDDVAALFQQSGAGMSEALRAQTHEVAKRVFRVDDTGPLAPGDRLGSYEVVRLLGLGGQAFVYEARHYQIGRHVALKVPQGEVAERLLNEARLATKIDHPHVVRVEDVGEAPGPRGPLPYLVMELCPGGSLADLLGEFPQGMPLPLVREVSDAVLAALGAAHAAGIVHRDVKPANVLFDAEGRAKLSDLGIGTLATAGETLAHSIERSRLTQGAIGTPAFMAPEQEQPELLSGAPIDGRADLFAFGKVLFCCLTGASPTTVRPPSRVRRELEPAWDELVFRLLEERREERPADTESVQAELAALCDPARLVAHALTLPPEERDLAHRSLLGDDASIWPLQPAASPGSAGPALVVRPREEPEVVVRPREEPGLDVRPRQGSGQLPAPGGKKGGMVVFAGAAAALACLAGLLLAWGSGALGWTFLHDKSEMNALALSSGIGALLLAWFTRSEERSRYGVGVLAALLLAAPLCLWQPALALTRVPVGLPLLGHRQFMALTQFAGVATLFLGVVLGFSLSARARSQQPPPPVFLPAPIYRPQPRPTSWLIRGLNCLGALGCLFFLGVFGLVALLVVLL